jgi:hypothetical protein
LSMKALLATGNETEASGILGVDSLGTLNFTGNDSSPVLTAGETTMAVHAVVSTSLVPLGTVETMQTRVDQDLRDKQRRWYMGLREV